MFLVTIFILVGVAYYIVTERKGLGIVQRRQGPNKVRLKGVLQPIADGVKLLTKEISVPYSASVKMFFLGPFLCFFCAYTLWLLYPARFSCVSFQIGLLFFLCISSFRVYGVFLTGWVCDSRYAFLGAIRAVAQRVSYEVFLRVCLFCPLVLVSRFDLVDIRRSSYVRVFLGVDLIFSWVICVLAETNRAPFDFVEGESELVAGYRVEFGGLGFALLALAEYRNIMFIRILTVIIFFRGVLPRRFFGNFIIGSLTVLMSYFLVWVRGVVPRFRYDLLINLCWQILLPLNLSILIFYACVVIN